MTRSATVDLPWHIYVLIDPRNNKERYVGRTYYLHRRFDAHMRSAGRGVPTHCARWIASLSNLGLEPRMVVIHSGTGPGCGEAEQNWICWYRKNHYHLTNLTDGGDGGTPGYKYPESSLIKMSAAQKKNRIAIEVLRRHNADKKSGKYVVTESARARMSAAAKCRKTNPTQFQSGHVGYKGARKLTDAQVVEIYRSTESSYVVAPLYNVCPTLVQKIRSGKLWKDLCNGK